MNMKHAFRILVIVFVTFTSCNNQKQFQMKTTINNHSYSNPNEVVPKHLHLNLTLNFDSNILVGYAEWDINPLKSAEYLILDVKQMDIEGIEVDAKIIDEFRVSESHPIFGSALQIPITSKTSKVRIYYRTHPDSEALQWLKPEQTAGKTHPFLFTQSQAILARTWIPCMDVPEIRFTYTADIKCPQELLPLMSAINPTSKNDNGIYSFEMPQPIPSYLLALAAGDLVYRKTGDNSGVYAEPVMLDKSVNEFSDLDEMIKVSANLFGEYKWGQYDVLVLPPSFPFGGMENPRLTFATPTIITGDKSLVSLIAHELAHSWSGNLVTNKTWQDFWLNEGFTVYFESRIMEELYGKDYADMLTLLGHGELMETVENLMHSNPEDTKLYLNLEGRNPDDGVTDIAYEKGRFMLLAIENEVGRDAWDQFLNKYFADFAFKTIDTKTFLEYLDKELFNQYPEAKKRVNPEKWIFETGMPEIDLKLTSDYLRDVEDAVYRLENGGDIGELNNAGWTTHHWLHFLRTLSHVYFSNHMEMLDKQYGFTQSKNAEIQCDWFKHCIRFDYQKAKPEIENFLLTVGRRKFLKPLYEQMVENNNWTEFAYDVFKRAEPRYHAVSANTIREILANAKPLAVK
jgi:leukotriene-A4 hydrolase